MLWLLRSLAYSMSTYFCVHTSYIIFDAHVQPSQLSILAACILFLIPVTTSSQTDLYSCTLNLSMPLEIRSIHKALPPFLFAKAVENLRERFLDMALRMAFWPFLLVSEDPIWISYGFLIYLSWFLPESPMWPWRLACVSIWYLIWVAIQTGTIFMNSRNSDEPATMSSSSIIFGCRLLRKSEKVEPIHLSLFLSLGANSC